MSPTDVWAVGSDTTGSAVGHWSAGTWTAESGSTRPSRPKAPANRGGRETNSGADQYAYYNGTSWSAVPGATPVPGTSDDSITVTAHVPGTNAT